MRSLFPVRALRCQIARVIATHASLPRYALSTPSFRFRALASLAGRAALGGPREVALATYLVARLAHDCLPTRVLPPAVRATRAAFARTWLSSLTLPPAVRAPLTRVTDATENDLATVGDMLRVLLPATATYLDAGARAELERLARTFSA